jgi:hydrogenase/urease accessory protein HupE
MTHFIGGMLHPLLAPTHLAAMLALALLIGQQGWNRGAPIVYVGALLLGLGAIAWAYVPARTEESLLAFAALAGLLVALARPVPHVLGWFLAGAIGVALALDSPPEAILLRDANVTLIGTALGATITLFILVQGTSRLGHASMRIGGRILGSWIAASAILVLALRLVR